MSTSAFRLARRTLPSSLRTAQPAPGLKKAYSSASATAGGHEAASSGFPPKGWALWAAGAAVIFAPLGYKVVGTYYTSKAEGLWDGQKVFAAHGAHHDGEGHGGEEGEEHAAPAAEEEEEEEKEEPKAEAEEKKEDEEAAPAPAEDKADDAEKASTEQAIAADGDPVEAKQHEVDEADAPSKKAADDSSVEDKKAASIAHKADGDEAAEKKAGEIANVQ